MSADYLFISCHHADGEALAKLSQALVERGINTCSSNGTGPAILAQAPAMAVCLGPQGLDQRQKRDIGWALARQAEALEEQTGRVFPIIPILLPAADLTPAFLFRHAWVDLRYNLANPLALDRLAEAVIRGTAPQRPIATLVDLCPYRGLQAFREEDAAFFFGREAVTERLLAEVASRNLVALVGPIGSGKSSIINAGLLPQLRRQGQSTAIHQSQTPNPKPQTPNLKWEVLSFTPGHQPFHRLAAALNNLLDNSDLPKADWLIETRRLGDQLAQGEARLEQVVEHALALSGDTDRLLLVVDQFEELVALTPASERRPFVEILLQALQQPKLSLLLALRANFYGDASLLSPALSQYLERSVINLGPLTRAELERVMVKPTRPVTLAFEPELVERMLNDIEQAPSQLPLLEFTLAELWRHHEGGLLSHAVYDRIGQVNGAIAYRAEQLWHSFSAKQQLTAQRLLTRLMRLTQDGQPIYERVSLSQLASELEPEESGQVRTVLEACAEVQLLLLSRDEVTDEPVVQIAHETLAQHWPRWQNWLKEEREFLLWRQRLQGSMVGWERVEPHPKNLLRGAALLEAEQWLAKRRDRFDAEGRVYIWQSLARWNWERDLRWLIGLGMALTLILIFVITIAQQNAMFAILRQERNGALETQVQAEARRQEAEIAQATAEAARQEAEQQRQVTLVRFLAAQARTELDARLDRAMLLAIESLRRLPSVEGERTLHQGLALLPHPVATIQQGTEVNALIFSPDGQWLVTGGKSAIPRVWQTATGQYVPPLGGDQGFPISASIQLSAHPTQGVTEAATDRVAVVAFSPDERWLATGSWDGVVRVWAVETSQLVAQLTHGDAVTALAFSPARPNGTGSQWLAVGSWDGSVRIWPLTLDWLTESDGKLVLPPHPILKEDRDMLLKAHKDVVLAITFSPDGAKLATTSADNTARLWDVVGMFEQDRSLPSFDRISEETWELARLSHQSAVWSAAFSPDGRWLATGSSDRSARLWDISADSDTSQEVARLIHPDDVKNVAFSPDGLWLVTVSADNVARVWLTLPRVAPAGTARQPVTQMAHSGQINAVVFSPNSRWLATASADHTARLWEVATGQEVAQMAHDEAVLAVAFSPTSRDKAGRQWIATASRDGVTRVWEATTGQEVTQLEQSDWILGLHFSPDGRRLAARSREIVRVWTMETGQLVAQMIHPGWIHTADFSSDGRWLATGSRDKMARIWEVATGAEVAALAHPGQVQIVAFNPVGRQLATASRDHIVRLWNVAAMIDPGVAVSSRELQLVHRGWVYALDYSPDGRWLATASADKTARIWDVETGQEVARLTHDEAVLDVAFSPASPDSPSSRWLATASADHTVRLWSVSTGREVARLIHEGRVEEVLFSPDGRRLASKSRNIVQVWDVARPLNTVVTSEQELARLSHPESVRAVAFSPDGEWLATTTGNPPGTGSAYLWKTATGEKVTSRLYEYWVTSVAFSPDGRWLVTGGGDRQAHVWLLQPKDLITEACARLTRNLTRLEWEQYLGDEPYHSTCPNLPFEN